MKTPLLRVTARTAWDQHDAHVDALDALEERFKAKVGSWLPAHRGEYVALQGDREIFSADYSALRAELDLTRPYFISRVESSSE